MQNDPLVTSPKQAQPCMRACSCVCVRACMCVRARGAGQSLLSLRWQPLTLPVLCPQEPDQVYEGITFDDFLKVRVRGEKVVGVAVVGLEGEPAGQEETGISVERVRPGRGL